MPVEIAWSPVARARLKEIQTYIDLDKLRAAERLATRIVAAIEALRLHPHLGRPGREPGVRELVIGATPYIVVYRLRGDRILINTIWRGAQRRDP